MLVGCVLVLCNAGNGHFLKYEELLFNLLARQSLEISILRLSHAYHKLQLRRLCGYCAQNLDNL